MTRWATRLTWMSKTATSSDDLMPLRNPCHQDLSCSCFIFRNRGRFLFYSWFSFFVVKNGSKEAEIQTNSRGFQD